MKRRITATALTIPVLVILLSLAMATSPLYFVASAETLEELTGTLDEIVLKHVQRAGDSGHHVLMRLSGWRRSAFSATKGRRVIWSGCSPTPCFS